MTGFDHQDRSTFLNLASPLQAIISPSILASNFARLEEECRSVLPTAQWLHVDVMDGHFVPNISIGPCVVESLRRCSPHWFLDVHLMVSAPAQWVAAMAAAGASQYTLHLEATDDAAGVCRAVRAAGMQVGVALKPGTEVTPLLLQLLDDGLVDMVLIMTVEPGFGGQSFMHAVLPKVTALRQRYANLSIEVDGGLSAQTIEAAAAAGANVIVAGTSVFKAADRAAEIGVLKACVEKHIAAGLQQQKL
ncbi:ribulose-5-phosphate 3-epimerase [Strigomonas culicis]|nr:ribulose-5-phosphate 3-epimerase [Strigomonas culicis]|eukprot:EPY33744.1 ribulose-5-phosphate 3-epimerase [Strigomonas culicis]